MLTIAEKNKIYRIVKDHLGLLKTIMKQQGHMIGESEYLKLKNEILSIEQIINKSENGHTIKLPKPDEVVQGTPHTYQKYAEQEESA